MILSLWQYGLGLAALGCCLLIQRRLSRRRYSQYENLPFVRFDDNDTAARYLTESNIILHNGYYKYSKNGIPFRMTNPSDPDHPRLILPFNYLEEVKMLPPSQLSFQLFSRQTFLLDYLNAPRPTDMAIHIVRGDVNKHLAYLTHDMHELARDCLTKGVPECEDWTPFQPYFMLAQTIASMTSLVLAGPELSESEEWREMMVQATIVLMQTSQGIRAKYPRYLRWIAPWIDPGARNILKMRHRAAELLRTSYESRLAGRGASGKPFVDGVQWLIDSASGETRSLLEIADEQLFLSMASIHSSSASTLSVLYDLCDRPQYMPGLLEEIRRVYANNGHKTWTKRSLEQLEKLDSFMKESQRCHPMGMVTVTRSTARPYTFSDGLRIPPDTQCAFPNYELNHDGDVYPDPESFDPERFLRMRRETDPNKFHFAYVSENSINFGAGTHSCPGRHMASNEMKMVLSELLLNYEIRWPEGHCRPPPMFHDFTSTPNPMLNLLFRRRKE